SRPARPAIPACIRRHIRAGERRLPMTMSIGETLSTSGAGSPQTLRPALWAGLNGTAVAMDCAGQILGSIVSRVPTAGRLLTGTALSRLPTIGRPEGETEENRPLTAGMAEELTEVNSEPTIGSWATGRPWIRLVTEGRPATGRPPRRLPSIDAWAPDRL